MVRGCALFHEWTPRQNLLVLAAVDEELAVEDAVEDTLAAVGRAVVERVDMLAVDEAAVVEAAVVVPEAVVEAKPVPTMLNCCE